MKTSVIMALVFISVTMAFSQSTKTVNIGVKGFEFGTVEADTGTAFTFWNTTKVGISLNCTATGLPALIAKIDRGQSVSHVFAATGEYGCNLIVAKRTSVAGTIKIVCAPEKAAS